MDVKLILLLATDKEKKLLISDYLNNLPNVKIIITGIGQKDVINSIKEYDFSIPVINIGLTAGTDNIPKNTVIPVTSVMPGFNYGNHQSPITLNLLSKENAYPCVSAPGFITDIYQFFPESCYSHDYLVDMELYTIASYFKTTSALKVVSDSGDFDDYLSALEDYDIMEPVRDHIYDMVCRYLSKK